MMFEGDEFVDLAGFTPAASLFVNGVIIVSVLGAGILYWLRRMQRKEAAERSAQD